MMRFHHAGIFTLHPQRMLNFYIKKLGFKKESQTVLPEHTVFSLFKVKKDCRMLKLSRDEAVLEIFWFSQERIRPQLAERSPAVAGYNHLGIEVNDREQFCSRLNNKFGIKIIKISRGEHYAYFIRDPDKNLIEVRHPQKSLLSYG